MYSGQKYLFQPTISRRSRERRLIEDCQVGFPIRTFRDQRVLSPPPDLSQSATSFIASCCQGIHQTPFSRLIRSRRRRALLRDGGSKPSTHPLASVRKSFDPRPRSRQREASAEVANDPLRDQRRLSVSVFLTWKDCPCSPAAMTLRSRSPTCSPRRTRPSPTRDEHKNVSCICSLNDVTGRMSPSGPQSLCLILRSDSATHQTMRRAIRSNHAPPGRSSPPIPSGKWWVEEELNLRPHAYQACALTT